MKKYLSHDTVCIYSYMVLAAYLYQKNRQALLVDSLTGDTSSQKPSDRGALTQLTLTETKDIKPFVDACPNAVLPNTKPINAMPHKTILQTKSQTATDDVELVRVDRLKSNASLKPYFDKGLIWQGAGYAPIQKGYTSTNIDNLDALLGGGWHKGAGQELLVNDYSCEWQLLIEQLVRCTQNKRCAVLIAPPMQLLPHYFLSAGVDLDYMWVLTPGTPAHFCYVVSQACVANIFDVVIAWDSLKLAPSHIKKCFSAVRQFGGIFFLMRPAVCKSYPSPADVRLQLTPTNNVLNIRLFKRKGLVSPQSISIALPWYLHDKNRAFRHKNSIKYKKYIAAKDNILTLRKV